jgi:hypothetical protein
MTPRTIEHARYVGYFAARWYLPMKNLCEEFGFICPVDAFRWKAVPKKTGNSISDNQDQGGKKISSGPS